ncbi:unnamed protein product [Adineta steineri]|uniref:ethanolamine kinase n=1 Tax=Adineta steineri TaxID=433720 RepID=A0A818PDG8_9BILA|nr:unnamed protein product [Adineta steineri]
MVMQHVSFAALRRICSLFTFKGIDDGGGIGEDNGGNDSEVLFDRRLDVSSDQLELPLNETLWTELSTEINFIRAVLNEHWSKHNLSIVLCLNNLHIDNFLYNSVTKTTTIIDFDHCLNNYFLFGIVSYFLELIRNNSENEYPERHIQKLFLIQYLKQTSLNLSNLVYDHLKPTDIELERLCDLCGLLIAPIHLY